MDDQQSAALRRRAQEAGLGDDFSRLDDAAVAEFAGWAAPSEGGKPGPTLSALSPKRTIAAAPPPPGAPPRPRAAEAAAAAPASLLSVNLDAAAMAQTLREAAQSGAPFCEECEKLRQQQRASA